MPASPWDAFCAQMRGAVEGGFHYDKATDDHAGSATLWPRHPADVQHAHRLCVQHGVTLALDLGSRPASLSRPVLWVSAGVDLGSIERLQPDGPSWFVQPGCMLGQLEAAGLPGFDSLPGHLSVAEWLADRALCNWPRGQTALSGISHLSVLLADGSSAVLGPFGAHQETPLAGGAQRRLVSSLFELVASSTALPCLQAPQWPGRYRLDALRPAQDGAINLAHLMAGHGGNLAWVEWVVLDERLLGRQAEGAGDGFTAWRGGDDPALQGPAQALDACVKTLFDPTGLYASSTLFQ